MNHAQFGVKSCILLAAGEHFLLASVATGYQNMHFIEMSRLASVTDTNRIAGLAGRSG